MNILGIISHLNQHFEPKNKRNLRKKIDRIFGLRFATERDFFCVLNNLNYGKKGCYSPQREPHSPI